MLEGAKGVPNMFQQQIQLIEEGVRAFLSDGTLTRGAAGRSPQDRRARTLAAIVSDRSAHLTAAGSHKRYSATIVVMACGHARVGATGYIRKQMPVVS